MASATLKSVLTNTLEGLSGEDMRRFCLLLVRNGRYIPFRSLLIGDPTEITETLVSIFGEDETLSLAAETLRKMGQTDQADRLVTEVRRQSGPKSSLPSGEHVVDHYKDRLIHEVIFIEPILDELLTKGVIQQDTYDEISALSTSQEKMRELFDGHLKTDESKDIFNNFLLKNLVKCMQPPVIRLQGPSSSPPMSSHNALLEALAMELRLSGDSLLESDDKNVSMRRVHHSLLTCDREMAPKSKISSDGDWIKLDPEVNCVDADVAPIYNMQSEAGRFECSVSGLRWVCKEKVCFKYQFVSWGEHMERLESMHYIPGGPLMDVKIISGKFDEAYLPHWICTEEHPSILGKLAVLHIDSCGDVVEEVSGVRPSHVKLSQPVFSPRGVLMRAGFPVKIYCKVLIYKTSKAFLTLHVYLIPRDPALQETIKHRESSSGYKMIQKPYPEKSLKMRDHFILSTSAHSAEIYPEKLKLIYESDDPNFFEVFISNPDRHFQLTLTHESAPVWTCAIRNDDYQDTTDSQGTYEQELARVRPELVGRVSKAVIDQLLDDLLKDCVLNEGEKELILQEHKACANRARCLIDMVKKKGHEAMGSLFTHLHRRDPKLSAQLGLPPGPSV